MTIPPFSGPTTTGAPSFRNGEGTLGAIPMGWWTTSTRLSHEPADDRHHRQLAFHTG